MDERQNNFARDRDQEPVEEPEKEEVAANPDEAAESCQDTARPPYFELAEDDSGWHWMLYAGNGRPLATSVRPIKRQHDLKRTLKVMISEISRAKILVQQ